MAYNKQNFVDGQVLTAAMLNKIENGVIENENAIANIKLTPGPEGPQGPQGPQGEPGTPADLTGYATEAFVEQKIAEAELGGSNGEAPDLSGYLTETEADEKYQPKGNYLTEHQTLKTINGQSLVGTGNITIEGGNTIDDSYNILFVGSSYAQNGTRQIGALLADLGMSNVNVRIAYGGRAITEHINNLKEKVAKYDYQRCVNPVGTNTMQKGIILQDILTDMEWDLIILQQIAASTDNADSYDNVYELINYIKRYCPNAKLAWYMTWQNADSKYEDIVAATKAKILPNAFFDIVIPVGTVIQNADTSFVDHSKIYMEDEVHLMTINEPFGGYVASLGTIKGIFNEKVNLDNVTYKATLSNEEFLVALESVANAYQRPFEVTQSVYVDEGTLPNYTFTISATPADAKVVIDGVERTSITVEAGTVVSWEVSAEGYETQNGTTTVSADNTLTVELALPPVEPDEPEPEEPSNLTEYSYGLIYKRYYQPTGGVVNTSGSRGSSANNCATEIFTKETLPVGSQIILVDGTYNYKKCTWPNATDKGTSSGTTFTDAGTIDITEDWWSGFEYVGFNIKRDDSSNFEEGTYDAECRAIFKIMVPVTA